MEREGEVKMVEEEEEKENNASETNVEYRTIFCHVFSQHNDGN